ncbi:MAG: chitobiase/beta-hexosaminidase C-terminal domain-containing protein [Candidatus Hydrogenedentes bacterium]|nr:chitobiase/beta-hexosaminidase C-terminal domain-containing protein [Candidatus Hydrogenedentota bacterium]
MGTEPITSEWTPEAREYLEGYLKQVGALARRDGEDAEDVTAGLREHIQTKLSESAGTIVSLDMLERVLAEVGTPAQVMAAEFSAAKDPTSPPTARAIPIVRAPSGASEIPKSNLSGRVLRWVGTIAIVYIIVLVCIGILGIIAAIVFPIFARSRMSANEAAAANDVRTLIDREETYRSAHTADENNDGVSDYGTLGRLLMPDIALMSGTKQGYSYKVTATPSSPTSGPAFTIIAKPVKPGRTGVRRYFADESGVIRFTTDGTNPTASSPPLNQP